MHIRQTGPFSSHSEMWCGHREILRFPPSSFKFGSLSELRRVETSPHLIFFLLSNLPGAVERAKKEAAEKEQEMLRQRLQEQQQQMEAQKKSLQENIDQLEKKLAWERENLLREQNMILEHKLKVSTAMASGVLDGHQCATPERFGCRSQQDVEGSIIALYCL